MPTQGRITLRAKDVRTTVDARMNRPSHRPPGALQELLAPCVMPVEVRICKAGHGMSGSSYDWHKVSRSPQ